MASLLERMQPANANSSAGPVRSRAGAGRAASLPYERPSGENAKRRREEDVSVWRHDLYKGPGADLSSRLAETSTRPLAVVDASGPRSALRSALGLEHRRAGTGAGPLSIRGASAANVVQVENLAKGTTAADVESIFKSCGAILDAYVQGPKDAELVAVRIKYKSPAEAQRAVAEFDGKSADGHKLRVAAVGSAGTRLGGRFGGTAVLGGTVDVLMDDDSREPGGSGSKMRSDELLSDPRAQVLTMPPGAEHHARGGGRGRGRRGRGGRGGRGRGAGAGNAPMNVD